MALRGINLPLAWVGYEKLLFDLFQDIGLHETEILDFFSGPAFQAWNRFGNVQDSWGGQRLPLDWIEGQFELQKKIVARMVELGMTPVLPAFTGFVPREFDRVFPNASTVTAPQWSNFPIKYTNVTFLEPTDYRFAQLQQSFIAKQQAAYGNITHVYTLDQYNGMNPSGDPSDLRHLARSTINSLKKADPSAVWMMQGWIFYIDPDFWTEQRIQAFLSGVSTNTDMLILDFYSESHPLWRSTDSYYGKPWIWCMLHAFGGNMELYGQVMNLTIDPVEALAASPSLVGFGLTPDAQEGNEVVYDLLLKQAWSDIPIDVEGYFRDWVSTRYADPGHHSGSEVPHPLYHAWSIIASTVYNNTNSTYAQSSEASILTKEPSLDLSTYVPFDLIRTSIDYDPSALIRAWTSFISAASSKPSLWINPAFLHDLVDLTRQILANEFLFVYTDLISIYTSSSASASASKRGKEISGKCDKMLTLLYALDAVLETNPAFRLDTWVESARRSADAKTRTKSMAEYFAFSARNQVTLFGPNGEILDSACKEWSGLVRGYYAPRWKIFTDYIKSTPAEGYNATVVHGKMTEFETEWMAGGRGREDRAGHGAGGDLKGVLGRVRREFGDVFR